MGRASHVNAPQCAGDVLHMAVGYVYCFYLEEGMFSDYVVETLPTSSRVAGAFCAARDIYGHISVNRTKATPSMWDAE